MTTDKREALFRSLAGHEYRHDFAVEHIRQGLAFQIRALRDKHDWTQEQLAEATGKKQETVSRLENPDYGRYSLSTLTRLAAAFDVALLVRFAPFSELVDWASNLTPERLAPPSFAEELESKHLFASGISTQVASTPDARGSFAVTNLGSLIQATGTAAEEGYGIEEQVLSSLRAADEGSRFESGRIPARPTRPIPEGRVALAA